jgi:two-component system, sensor histidine kinase LadS
MGIEKMRLSYSFIAPLFFLILASFGFGELWALEASVRIEEKDFVINLTPHALIFEDKDAGYDSFEKLLLAEDHGKLSLVPVSRRNLGLGKSVWWIKLEVHSALSKESDALLQLRCPSIDFADAWVYSSENLKERGLETEGRSHIPPLSLGRLQLGSREPEWQSGRDVSANPPLFPHPVLPLRFAPGEGKIIYLRLQSLDNIYLDLRLSSWPKVMAERLRAISLLILVYGIITAMIFFNLILLSGRPDGITVAYLLYLLSILLYLLSADGILFQLWFWKIPYLARRSNLLFSITSVIALLVFTRAFLQVPGQYPKADRLLRGFILLSIMLLLPIFFTNQLTPVMVAGGISELLFLLFLLYLSLRAMIAGNRQAIYYLLSWGVLIFLVGLTQLRTLGLLPPDFLSTGALNIGVAFQVVMLSAGLADRMRTLDKENLLLRSERERLEEQYLQRRTLLINISHELRTPLTILKGISRDLKMGKELSLRGKEGRGGAHSIGTMARSIDRIVALTGRISDVMHTDKQLTKVDLVKASVAPLLVELVKEYLPMANKVGLTLQLHVAGEELLCVDMDRELLRRALSNLVDNGIKYTRRGRVDLFLDSIPKEAESSCMVRIRISDTGIGIPPEEGERIFQRFYRLPAARSLGRDGLGIGLSIVKEIVNLHGGTISLESSQGGGTTFTLLFPRLSHGDVNLPGDEANSISKVETEWDHSVPGNQNPLASPGKAGTGRSAHHHEGGCRILLVEDDLELLSYLEDGLSSTFLIKSVPSVEAALTLFEDDYLPDLVVSDIVLSGEDGRSLFRRMQREEKLRSIPFLFISARDRDDEPITLMEEGAADYLIKPFSLDYLRVKILSILRIRSLSTEDMGERIRMAATEHSLTTRQTEILKLLLQGKSKKEIAEFIKPLRGQGKHVSIKTVDNHIQSIYRILQVHSHSELISRFSPGR